MSPSSRALRMSALVSLLMVMGCPTSPTDTTTTSTNVIPATLTHPGGTGSPTTVAGSTVTGTLLGAGDKPISGVTVTLTDARAIQVPNSGDSKTDGSGKFSLKQVPVSSTWLVLADVDGNRMAGVVKPNAKKTVDCKITLFTTLAVAGIQPYFVEDVKAPDRVVYDLRDLPLDKFDDLVAAITKAAPDVKPSAKLKDLNTPFTALKDKDAAVKAAFDALFQQIQINALVRQSGGTPDPNAKTPGPAGSGATPTPAATSTVSLSTPVPTPTPTPTPSGFGATPTPVPTKNYSALNVTLSTDALTLASTAASLQADKVTVSGQTALLIPDDTKIHVIAALPNVPDIDPAATLGSAVDGIRAVSVSGTNVYAIANVGGVPSVITMSIGATLAATATSKPLITGSGLAATTHCSGLAYVSIKNGLIASDPDQHVLLYVDPTNGNTSLYCGIAGKSDTPGPAGGGLASGYGLNTPGALLFYNGNIWICDSGNHRILYCNSGTNLVNVYSGKADDSSSVAGEALTKARYKNPVSIIQANNHMYVADADENCIRILNLDKNDSYLTTGAKDDNNQFIFKCRMAGELNGKIYAANSSGKVVKFDDPALPN